MCVGWRVSALVRASRFSVRLCGGVLTDTASSLWTDMVVARKLLPCVEFLEGGLVLQCGCDLRRPLRMHGRCGSHVCKRISTTPSSYVRHELAVARLVHGAHVDALGGMSAPLDLVIVR